MEQFIAASPRILSSGWGKMEIEGIGRMKRLKVPQAIVDTLRTKSIEVVVVNTKKGILYLILYKNNNNQRG